MRSFPSRIATGSSSLLAALVITAVVWGSLAFRSLPRQEEPRLTWRLANVVTRLPGASPARIESHITDVIEQYVQQVDEVHHLYSVSRAGVSLVQIELHDRVTDAAPVWQKVRHKLAAAALEFPPGAAGPDLDDEILGTSTILIAVCSESADDAALRRAAERLETQLRYLSGTASTTLVGEQQEVVEVRPDAARLAAYDLSFESVAAALRGRNVQSPSGRLSTDQGEWLLEASGEFDTVDEIASLLVLADGRHTLRLGDIAEVCRTSRTPADPLARYDGARSVIVAARARDATRLDHYSAQVRQALEAFRDTLPPDIQASLVHDLGRYTAERMNQLAGTLLLSVLLVLISTALWMNLRAACVVAATIPLTGLLVMWGFSVLRVPLNEMSIMAIVMALGLLVDNAIIVTEQIHRRAGQGVPLELAATDEPRRLIGPLSVATLTTIAAFLPIWLLPGGVGEFVRAIPVGVALSLVISLAVAFQITPWLCVMLLGDTAGRDPARPGRGFGSRFVALRAPLARRYRRWLLWVVRRPATSLAVIVLLAVAGMSLGLGLRRDFFSPVQRDQFVIDLFAPQGSNLEDTRRLVEQVERILADEPDVAGVLALVGRNAPLVFYNLTSQETYANHFAQLIVTASDWRTTAAVAEGVQRKLDAAVAGADCCVRILEHGAPFAAPLEVRITGSSIDTLRELGADVQRALAATPDLRNVRTNFGTESIKLVAQVNEPVARSLGLDQQALSDQLRQRLDGMPAGHFYEDDERIELVVRLAPHARHKVVDLWNVLLNVPAAAQEARGMHRAARGDAPMAPSTLSFVPLETVATMQPQWQTASIYRRDGERTLSVLAYPRFGRTAAEVSSRLLPELNRRVQSLPPGYRLELGGENEQRQEAESNLLGAAPWAVGLIVIVLVAQFRRWSLVGLVLGVMPLAIAGAMVGLVVTGWPLNFMAMMGMIMLLGVVVNDAVLLIDGYERRRAAGQALLRRTLIGTRERSRHVAITTITTVAAFLPLAISPSLLWPPLAIAIIGGLTLATLLTLLGVPAAYILLHRRRGTGC